MFVLGWLFFSIAAGMFAHIHRNRNGVGWFVISMIASPIVAFVLLAILKPAEAPGDLDSVVERVNIWNVMRRSRTKSRAAPR